MNKISKIWSREILDSRGIPTVESACMVEGGAIGVAAVPSGTSTGTYEALELRDKDNSRYLGEGVLKAVNNVNTVLGQAILGMDAADQIAVDTKLVQTDGTENKSKYGANAILSISMAVCRAASIAQRKPLYAYIFDLAKKGNVSPTAKIPIPLFVMIEGGLHGAGNLDFQEFWLIPASHKTFAESLQIAVETYQTMGKNLARRGAIHSIGQEGAYAPNLFTNADAFEVFIESIKQTNYSLGRDVFLGLDVAANTFYKNGEYQIKDKSSPMEPNQFLDYYKSLVEQYRLAILEDPFFEDAWESWTKISQVLSANVTIVGDDLLVTNPKRIQKAIEQKACNGIIIKPNQIGTVSETLSVVKQVKDVGWKTIISHRAGETNDTFIADFAVGVGSDYVKFGAPARGERVAKYNRLLAIEYELSKSA